MVILIEGRKILLYSLTVCLLQLSSVLASVIFMFSPDWKKKDEEHAEWDRRRRSSLEQVREGVGRMRLCKFAFTLYHPYLVCLLFGMPSLHLVTFLKFFSNLQH